MMIRLNALRKLLHDSRGAAAIETAIVAPVLVTMSMGSFEVGNIIARQAELQGAMAEASSVALASEPTTPARRTTLKSIIKASTGLDDNKVTVEAAYRCGANAAFTDDVTTCAGVNASSYVKIVLTDSYTPAWTKFGVGSAFQYGITRYVMIKQS